MSIRGEAIGRLVNDLIDKRFVGSVVLHINVNGICKVEKHETLKVKDEQIRFAYEAEIADNGRRAYGAKAL